MKKEYVYIEGKAMYARVFEHNRDLEGYEGANLPFDGIYEIALGVPDKGEDFKTIMGWNSRYEPKRVGDSDGFSEEKGAVPGYAYFRFRRKHKHLIRQGKPDEKVVREWGGPPKILDKDGKPWDEDVPIGNGSDVVVKLHVGVSQQGRKTVHHVRLEGVLVKNLVVFEKDTDNDNDNGEAQGLPDDEIPF